jgi:hypothetical protein
LGLTAGGGAAVAGEDNANGPSNVWVTGFTKMANAILLRDVDQDGYVAGERLKRTERKQTRKIKKKWLASKNYTHHAETLIV